MKKLFLLSFLLLATATAFAQTSAFVDNAQRYEFMDGKTIIKMNCNGIATVKNQQNDFGRHYETVMYVTNGKKENYFQGVIHKDTLRQISARRTSKTVFSSYVWDGDTIVRYDMKTEFKANYDDMPKTFIINENTVDLCGLIYQLRRGTPARTLENETLLIDQGTLPLSDVEVFDNGQTLSYSIKIGNGYHISSRIRKDESRTPEYLDIDIPGFTTKASLVEHGSRIALR